MPLSLKKSADRPLPSSFIPTVNHLSVLLSDRGPRTSLLPKVILNYLRLFFFFFAISLLSRPRGHLSPEPTALPTATVLLVLTFGASPSWFSALLLFLPFGD